MPSPQQGQELKVACPVFAAGGGLPGAGAPLLARFAPSTARRWCWDPSRPKGCPTCIPSRSLWGSGLERQKGGSCNSPRVTLIFCFYEQILATEPKSIASSAGREDLASEKDLDFVLGSLYDLANNDSVGPKWTEMRYWWLLLIKEQDVFQSAEGLLPPDLTLALHLPGSSPRDSEQTLLTRAVGFPCWLWMKRELWLARKRSQHITAALLPQNKNASAVSGQLGSPKCGAFPE